MDGLPESFFCFVFFLSGRSMLKGTPKLHAMYADKVKTERNSHYDGITCNGSSSPLLKHSVNLNIQTTLSFVMKNDFMSAKANGLQYTITSAFTLIRSLILYLHPVLSSKLKSRNCYFLWFLLDEMTQVVSTFLFRWTLI